MNKDVYMEIDECLTPIEKRNEIRMMKSYIQRLENPLSKNRGHHKQYKI